MSVEIERLDDAEAWDELVARSATTTPFHRYDALRVVAEHTNLELHPLVGYVGQEPAGLFPLFERTIGPVSAAFSPPPNEKIPYLGPVTFADPNMKRRKRERRHQQFVDAALTYIDDHISPRFINVRTSVGYDDPRPFLWNEFSPTPRYTYHVDLTSGPDRVLSDASSDLRENVRKTDGDTFTIETKGIAGTDQILQNVRERYEEQGISYRVTPELVRGLSRAVPDAFTSYVCTVDGTFVGGTIVASDDDAVYRWQSVADFDASVPAQDLLDWHVICEACDDGIGTYDLVGANDARLCTYKAKFAPEMETYYRLARSGPGVGALAELYSRLR